MADCSVFSHHLLRSFTIISVSFKYALPYLFLYNVTHESVTVTAQNRYWANQFLPEQPKKVHVSTIVSCPGVDANPLYYLFRLRTDFTITICRLDYQSSFFCAHTFRTRFIVARALQLVFKSGRVTLDSQCLLQLFPCKNILKYIIVSNILL